jgi:hypothetical protein
MSYICYVYERQGAVPYMEVLAARSLEEARAKVRGLLFERPHCNTAELWDDDRLVHAFGREELAL